METVKQFVILGFTHVVPLGTDHILFILCLFFRAKGIRTLFIQCSIFTLAHTISLALSAADVIALNSYVVEPLIAISILFTAIDIIVNEKERKWRFFLIFVFGLIHGMGFANSIKDVGIPSSQFFTAILFFNLGVELGQLSVLIMAYYLVGYWFANKEWYKKKIVYPISSIIGSIALYWTIERLLSAGT